MQVAALPGGWGSTMGECYCSNIVIMQLFHELKQQFPALPDYIVSQCIAQNSHDRETCAQSLRATQESRPWSGGLYPSPPLLLAGGHPTERVVGHEQQEIDNINDSRERRGMLNHHRASSLNGVNGSTTKPTSVAKDSKVYHPRAQRPASLDISKTFVGRRQCCRSPNDTRSTRITSGSYNETPGSSSPAPPLSAPAAFYPTRVEFFQDVTNSINGNSKLTVEQANQRNLNNSTIDNRSIGEENRTRNRGNQSNATAFELNVNVACSPAGNSDFPATQTITAEKRLGDHRDLSNFGDSSRRVESKGKFDNISPNDCTRSYTSVSLTLRPPSTEPQAPIDISSQGSSLTYSSSTCDPRGFQSRLQISIGPGNVGSVASARIRPPMILGHTNRPTSLPTRHNQALQRPPVSLRGGPSYTQLSRPTTTMSAPTTPSASTSTTTTTTTTTTISLVQATSTNSLPTTPLTGSVLSPSVNSPAINQHNEISLGGSSLSEVTEHKKLLVAEQLMRKERLAKELRAEKGRLEAMKRELQALMRPLDSTVPHEDLKRNLRSDIYQLQLECDRLADEVDKRSDPRVPLGETNEEFYQGIYTGQPFALDDTTNTTMNNCPEATSTINRQRISSSWGLPANRESPEDNDNEERDGPSWVCRMCTFDNHPLMDKCEQCDMPRLLVHDSGDTQDIHIRVTHHHNFSPRRTVHSWVV